MTTHAVTSGPAVVDPIDPLPSRNPLRRASRALHEPAFRWWFGSQVLSSSGAFTQAMAQSWLILQITGHAIDLGVLGAITWLPVLLGSAWAGGLIDRFDLRRILACTQSAFVVLCTVQAVLISTGHIELWMIYAFGFTTGLVTAIDSPARQIYVMDLVGRDNLVSAVGLVEVVINASRVIGPATGGLLLATLGVGPCFIVNGLSYLPVLFVLARFGVHHAPKARVAKEHRPRLADALREVRHHGALGACILIAAAAGMIFNLGVAMPLLARQVFHLGGGGYGVMMACFGLGAVPGAIVAAGSVAHPSGTRVRVLTAFSAAAVLLTALAPDAVAACVGIASTGFLSIWLIAIANTLVQLGASPGMRGRIMGLWSMALPGAIPFTGMLTAVAGQVAGARVGYGLAGAMLALVVTFTWRTLGREP